MSETENSEPMPHEKPPHHDAPLHEAPLHEAPPGEPPHHEPPAAETRPHRALDEASLHSAGPAAAPPPKRRTLIFANDKSSGKTTVASAVLVSLLQGHHKLLHEIAVQEYDRQRRLTTIFGREDGFSEVEHHDARNAAAFDASREIAYDPNATVWDELLFRIGAGGIVVDLGANMFADICRILDEEPRPVFPEAGEAVGVVVPMTTARDSIESGITAIEAALDWGERVKVFAVEQEFLGRFTDDVPLWPTKREALLGRERGRFQVLRVPKLEVADIGQVVFQRIDRLVADATRQLQDGKLNGADYIRAIRKARAELAWGSKTLEAVAPIAEWFVR